MTVTQRTNRSEVTLNDEVGAILLRTGWLADQPEAFGSALLQRCLVQRFRRGEVVYRRGDPPGGVYGLVSGSLAYVFPQAENEAHLVHVSLPGSWIGEAAVLRNKPRAITVKALAPSVAAYLPPRGFQDLVVAEPLAWRAFAMLAADHQIVAASIISEMLPQSPKVRLAARLLGLATQDPQGLVRSGAVLPITQTDLADMVGLSRPTVNKLLGSLENDGIVEVSYGRIGLLDVDGLIGIVDAERAMLADDG